MKKIFFLGLLMLGLSVKGQEIKLDSLTYKLGQIKKTGVSYKLKIYFTNIGEENLIIENVQTASTNATSDYPKEPISPNKKNFFEVMFIPDRLGNVTQHFTLVSNSKIQTRIPFKVTYQVVE